MDLLLPLLLAAVLYSFASLRVIRQYERAVAFFLGRYWGTKGPGMIFLPAGFAAQKRVSLRIMALDIPPQDVITRDNVSVKVNAVLYMRVSDPAKAIIEIEDYMYATSRPIGRSPRSRAKSSLATTNAAAPSQIPEAFPAVTTPSFRK